MYQRETPASLGHWRSAVAYLAGVRASSHAEAGRWGGCPASGEEADDCDGGVDGWSEGCWQPSIGNRNTDAGRIVASARAFMSSSSLRDADPWCRIRAE
jgi:hypothetical protein